MKWVRWIIVFGVLSSQTCVFAQDAKLVEAAKKEGGKGYHLRVAGDSGVGGSDPGVSQEDRDNG